MKQFNMLLLVLVFTLINGANAVAVDVISSTFIMVLPECKNVASMPYNLHLKKQGTQVMEGEPFIAICKKNKTDITCDYHDQKMKRYGGNILKVQYDNKGQYEFQTIDGLEHFIVDLNTLTASSLNITYFRPKDGKTGGLMTKNCAGMILTQDDLKAWLNKNK